LICCPTCIFMVFEGERNLIDIVPVIITRTCTHTTQRREGKSEQANIITPQPIKHYVSRGSLPLVTLVGIRALIYWGLMLLQTSAHSECGIEGKEILQM